MLWVKAFHVVAVVAWFAGLFYLPRLFVYHAMTDASDVVGRERFKVMERKLYRAIMTPAGIVATVLGLWLVLGWWRVGFAHHGWLHAKLALVVPLWIYHLWCGRVVRRFARDENTRDHRHYRVMNEVPTLLLVAIVILVIVKPF